MESENSYEFDSMMEDAMSRLNVIVDSALPTIAKKPQVDHSLSSDIPMDYIDEQEDISDCDCSPDSRKSPKCVELTQIYDSSDKTDTIDTIDPIAAIGENNLYEINYDNRYDYDFYVDDDDNDEDSNDDVYENIEHSYQAEKMDKQTGNFGRI